MLSRGANRNSRLAVFVLGALVFGFIGMPSALRAQDQQSKESEAAAAGQPKTAPETIAGVRLLTPTQGIDFSSYILHLLKKVKNNWYASMPDSARKGEKGTVTLKLRIQRDGLTAAELPKVEKSSGIRVLDQAAVKAVREAAPFEALPAEFHGLFIELRFSFFYNIPRSEIPFLN